VETPIATAACSAAEAGEEPQLDPLALPRVLRFELPEGLVENAIVAWAVTQRDAWRLAVEQAAALNQDA
jgi:hypothetical protein